MVIRIVYDTRAISFCLLVGRSNYHVAASGGGICGEIFGYAFRRKMDVLSVAATRSQYDAEAVHSSRALCSVCGLPQPGSGIRHICSTGTHTHKHTHSARAKPLKEFYNTDRAAAAAAGAAAAGVGSDGARRIASFL